MLTVALVLAGLAALVHVYIFWLEALAFDTAGRKAFGISAEDAAVMRPWAFNQGFYNAFLAIGVVAGLGLLGSNRDAGLALIVFATGSMLTAALVLVGSDPSKGRGALVQGLFPALSLISLAVWATT
jgi:putative membrane protein